MPPTSKNVPPNVPPSGVGFQNTLLDVKRQKPLIFQRLKLISRMCLDFLESNLGRHDWIRTSDLFRVKGPIFYTFNDLQAAGDCQKTRKYVEDGDFAGDSTGEKLPTKRVGPNF